MKARIITVLLMLAVLVSSITACTTKDDFLVKVMKLAPEDTYSIDCTDIEAMANDTEFAYMYDYFIDYLQYYLLGIDISDISAFGYIITDLDSIYVLMGDFALEDIRNILIDEGYMEGEYDGVEVWTDDYEDAVAFIGNIIIGGYTDTVEACIRVHKNEEPSMYDNDDMKSVADKLSSGVVSMVFGSDFTYGIEILAGGVCLRNQHHDDEVLDITGWLKFDSAASAEAALEDAEDHFGHEFDAINISSQLRDQFIELTGEVGIPEY